MTPDRGAGASAPSTGARGGSVTATTALLWRAAWQQFGGLEDRFDGLSAEINRSQQLFLRQLIVALVVAVIALALASLGLR